MGNMIELGGTRRATAERDLRRLMSRLQKLKRYGSIVPSGLAGRIIELAEYTNAAQQAYIIQIVKPHLPSSEQNIA